MEQQHATGADLPKIYSNLNVIVFKAPQAVFHGGGDGMDGSWSTSTTFFFLVNTPICIIRGSKPHHEYNIVVVSGMMMSE